MRDLPGCDRAIPADTLYRCLDRLFAHRQAFLDPPWQEVRESVDVKLLVEDGELYVLVRSEGRLHKDRAMRRCRLKRLWRRLGELQGQSNTGTS